MTERSGEINLPDAPIPEPVRPPKVLVRGVPAIMQPPAGVPDPPKATDLPAQDVPRRRPRKGR